MGKVKRKPKETYIRPSNEKSYDTSDLTNILSQFSPIGDPGFHLDAPLLRGQHVPALDCFSYLCMMICWRYVCIPIIMHGIFNSIFNIYFYNDLSPIGDFVSQL